MEKFNANQEIVEDKYYSEVKATEVVVKNLLIEIDKVYKSTSDRNLAEKIILDQWAPQMDEALKKAKFAFDSWIENVQKI